MRHLKTFRIFESQSNFKPEELTTLQKKLNMIGKSEEDIIEKTRQELQESGEHDVRDIDQSYVISYLKQWL